MYKKVGLSPEEQVVRVRMPRGKETFGIVDQTLGGNKLRVRYQDDKVRICRIPGKMRKRVWIRIGDVVLVEPWDIQGDKSGDVIWRYTPAQVDHMRRKNILRLEV
jgi:translation initiation factor 1A